MPTLMALAASVPSSVPIMIQKMEPIPKKIVMRVCKGFFSRPGDCICRQMFSALYNAFLKNFSFESPCKIGDNNANRIVSLHII